MHLAGRYPLGGIGWQALHYVLGLHQLGHDVHYVEDSGAHPYDPRVKSVVEDSAYGVAFLSDVMGRFDLGDRWTYVDPVTGAPHAQINLRSEPRAARLPDPAPEVRLAHDSPAGRSRPLGHPLRPERGAVHHRGHLAQRGQGHP